jgi:putative transposase
MTALAGVSRATYYRFDPDATAAVRDTELRDAIQRIALRFPAYGRPRITAELKRQGWTANHKRVGRILREDNLLCLRKKRFHSTTDSKHGFPVYPNLTRNFVPAARNQLWVADITYIRLAEKFVYLAVVLDAYSRLVIGWALERTLEAKLAIGALQMALDKRGPVAGVIHHSDRGVQYACGDCMRVERPRLQNQHEPQSQSIRQCESRKLHEDSKTRRSESCGVSRPRRSQARHSSIPRTHLQPQTIALSTRLPTTCGV